MRASTPEMTLKAARMSSSKYQTLSRSVKNRINAIQEFASAEQLAKRPTDQIQRVITEREQSGFQYDDSIVRQMIECIKVYPDGKA